MSAHTSILAPTKTSCNLIHIQLSCSQRMSLSSFNHYFTTLPKRGKPAQSLATHCPHHMYALLLIDDFHKVVLLVLKRAPIVLYQELL